MGCPGRVAGTKVNTSWEFPECFAYGAPWRLAGVKVGIKVPEYSVLGVL